MKKSKVFFISGFLGQPSDWDFLKEHARSWDFEFSAHSPEEFLPELYQSQKSMTGNYLFEGYSSTETFTYAANTINKLAEHEGADAIVGYSLGGRLALHALTQRSSRWKKGVVISAHPGLKDHFERGERLKSDGQWAKKFSTQAWNATLEQWNSQPVFSGSRLPLQRPEDSVNKGRLARLLTEFSLAHQENMRLKIADIQTPLLFVAGGEDRKFSELAEEMAKLALHGESWVVSQVGHRVPWEMKQKTFINKLKSFLETPDGSK